MKFEICSYVSETKTAIKLKIKIAPGLIISALKRM